MSSSTSSDTLLYNSGQAPPQVSYMYSHLTVFPGNLHVDNHLYKRFKADSEVAGFAVKHLDTHIDEVGVATASPKDVISNKYQKSIYLKPYIHDDLTSNYKDVIGWRSHIR